MNEGERNEAAELECTVEELWHVYREAKQNHRRQDSVVGAEARFEFQGPRNLPYHVIFGHSKRNQIIVKKALPISI